MGLVALQHVDSSRTRDQTCGVLGIARQILIYHSMKEVLSLYNQSKSRPQLNSCGHIFLYIWRISPFKFSPSLMAIKFSRARTSFWYFSSFSPAPTRYLADSRYLRNVVGWVNESCIIKDFVTKQFWGHPSSPAFCCLFRSRLLIHLAAWQLPL